MTAREPIHAFALPPEAINDLALRPGPQRSLPVASSSAEPASSTLLVDSTGTEATAGSLSCSLCLGATFSDVSAQRNHFRSDWHRYNVKRKLNDANAKPVSDVDFANLVENLEDSLSGSASSSDDDSDEDSDDAVSTLVRKHKKHRLASTAESSSDEGSSAVPRSPIIWFQSPSVPNTQYGAYSAIFPSPPPETPEAFAESLKEMQYGGEIGRRWALFMTAGGHFAGMIVRVSKPGLSAPTTNAGTGKKAKGKGGTPDLEIISHKTFHRYTTRRKQGGSQSVNDNAKGNAKSAGAQLRRYGEQALRDDIRALLVEWAKELNECERIFIRANVSNKRIFVDFEDSPIPKGDPRLRTFPFETRRPTLSELQRCLQELTRVKVTHLTEEELRAADEAFFALLQSKKRKPPPPAPSQPVEKKKVLAEKLSPEETALRERWTKLLEMIRKDRLDSLRSLWTTLASTHSVASPALGPIPSPAADLLPPLIDTRLPQWVKEEDGVGPGATLLQVATAAGNESIVQFLLDQRADPTIPIPSSSSALHPPSTTESEPPTNEVEDDSLPASRPASQQQQRKAYDLARTRPLRNIFRRAAFTHPEWFDWLGAGHVPSVLTPEMEASEANKKGARRKGLKEKMKERQAAQAQAAASEPEPPAPVPAVVQDVKVKKGPQKLGGPGAGGGASNAALDAMSPEMRGRIERERRARAAEARMKALGGGA